MEYASYFPIWDKLTAAQQQRIGQVLPGWRGTGGKIAGLVSAPFTPAALLLTFPFQIGKPRHVHRHCPGHRHH